MYGAVNLVGEGTNWEWAENVGEAGVYRAQEHIKERPEIVASYQDIDGFFGDEGFLQYIANNAAISMPYMAATMAGAVATPFIGASVLGVGALGLALSPVAMYSGNVWNEMEGDNKNIGLALGAGVTQAVLDRVGLKFLTNVNLLNTQSRNMVINKLANTRGISVEAAKQVVLNASRQEVAKFATDAARFAKQQLLARNVAKQTLKRVATAAGGEGVTEALQESIGYTAAHAANGFRDWNANDFLPRLTDATIAGATLGKAFAMPGAIYDYGAWADVAYRVAPNTGKQISKMGNFAKEDIARNGSQYNVQEENRRVKAETDNIDADVLEDLNQRVDRETSRRGKRDIAQLGRDTWRAIPGLWRGITRYAFGNMGFADNLQNDSVEARVLSESLGGNLQRSTSGQSYENRKHHLISQVRNMMGDVSQLLSVFNRSDKRKSRLEFSETYYEAHRQASAKARAEGRVNANGEPIIDWNRDLTGELRSFLPQVIAFHRKLEDVGNKLHEMQAEHNPELGKITDYLSRYKSLSKEAIENDRAEFEGLLVQELGMNPDQAKETAEAILSQDGVNEIITDADGEFSVTARSTFTPQSHRRRTLNLSDRASFQKFMERDLFTNLSNAAKSAVRYTTLEEYVGSDNKKINYRLAKIERELRESGWSEEDARARVDRLAYDLKNYFDAESGNYKRLQIPILSWAQKNLLFVTTITGLPLATISNFVELALVGKSLRWDQIFGKEGSINAIARSFVSELNNTARRTYGAATGSVVPHARDKNGHEIARELGYFDWEVGAAHTTGVSQTGHWRQRILDMYFKTILLQQWTNATRAARAAIAGDYITDKISIIAASREANGTFTNEVAEAEEALRNLGIDVDFMIDYHAANFTGTNLEPPVAEREKYTQFMNDAIFNFVNEAVALPQSANRPLIFQDPRFALFTQFQGFISTFQANHLPKMWAELVARGTPAMKYNAFATMTTMIALGFASQHLKDLMKYGKTTPYFKDMEYIRRGVGASGLLGTSERVIDFAFPMYQERYKTKVGWAFGTVSGESAALSKAVRIGDLSYDVATGDKSVGEAAVRVSPLAQAADQMFKKIPTWNFGEANGN